ncbi:MAG: hypothetical protein U0793_02285 [Gemmataceae bacterium]
MEVNDALVDTGAFTLLLPKSRMIEAWACVISKTRTRARWAAQSRWVLTSAVRFTIADRECHLMSASRAMNTQ